MKCTAFTLAMAASAASASVVTIQQFSGLCTPNFCMYSFHTPDNQYCMTRIETNTTVLPSVLNPSLCTLPNNETLGFTVTRETEKLSLHLFIEDADGDVEDLGSKDFPINNIVNETITSDNLKAEIFYGNPAQFNMGV